MGAHLIDGEFQSDKYPTTPRGKVPLSCKDPTAQDLLWQYAQRRREVDAEFSGDLEEALRLKGYQPSQTPELDLYRALMALRLEVDATIVDHLTRIINDTIARARAEERVQCIAEELDVTDYARRMMGGDDGDVLNSLAAPTKREKTTRGAK